MKLAYVETEHWSTFVVFCDWPQLAQTSFTSSTWEPSTWSWWGLKLEAFVDKACALPQCCSPSKYSSDFFCLKLCCVNDLNLLSYPGTAKIVLESYGLPVSVWYLQNASGNKATFQENKTNNHDSGPGFYCCPVWTSCENLNSTMCSINLLRGHAYTVENCFRSYNFLQQHWGWHPTLGWSIPQPLGAAFGEHEEAQKERGGKGTFGQETCARRSYLGS